MLRSAISRENRRQIHDLPTARVQMAWALFRGLGAYLSLARCIEEFARPFALALSVVGAIAR